jgi:antitoxin (DNA-binding transcriptional repressor) of toxin-antitoxin stability system
MTSINIRQLRETKRLKALLQAGQAVELRERNRVIARITPEPPTKSHVKLPDFAARAKKMFGKRRLPGADLLIEDRGRL